MTRNFIAKGKRLRVAVIATLMLISSLSYSQQITIYQDADIVIRRGQQHQWYTMQLLRSDCIMPFGDSCELKLFWKLMITDLVRSTIPDSVTYEWQSLVRYEDTLSIDPNRYNAWQFTKQKIGSSWQINIWCNDVRAILPAANRGVIDRLIASGGLK